MEMTFTACKFIVCLLSIMIVNQDSSAAWEQAGNHAPNLVNCLAVRNGALLLGTTTKGMFLSKDNGATWASANKGLPKDTVDSLYYSITSLAANTSEIFAIVTPGGYYRSQLYSSSNNGDTWEKIDIGAGYLWNWGLCDSALYIAKCLVQTACAVQLGLSYNNGLSWQALNTIPNGIDPRYVFIPLPIAMIGRNIFVGLSPSGIYLSANDGATWQPVNYGLSDLQVTSMAASGSCLFAATSNNGAFISKNGGTSWQKADTGLPLFTNSTVPGFLGRHLAVTGTNVFACSDSGVFLASNNSSRWVPVNTGCVQPVFDLAVSNDYLFALSFSNGVWRRPLSEMPLSILQKYSAKSNGFSYEMKDNNVVAYTLPRETLVSLNIYDLRGKLALAVVNKKQPAGSYSLPLEKASLSSGNYLMLINAGNLTIHRRIEVIR